jgi:hypothetical protein
MTTRTAYAWGYAIAALIFLPLTALAKAGDFGPLIIVSLTGFAGCILIRICTGEWP